MKRKRSTKILPKKFEPEKFEQKSSNLPNKKRSDIQHGIRYANFEGIASLDHIRPRLYYTYMHGLSLVAYVLSSRQSLKVKVRLSLMHDLKHA